MGVTRLLRRLLLWGGAIWGLTYGFVFAWVLFWPETDSANLAPADVIICFGAGMTGDGTLAPATIDRVARCAELYAAGVAPKVLTTGGVAAPDGPSAGGQMAALAQAFGVPAADLIIESRAQSTLQNGLFSLPLTDAGRIIIVSEGFHLPRCWASIRWAAWQLGLAQPDITLVMSNPVRRDPASGRINQGIILRETLALWFNGARAAAYSLGGALGIPPDDRIDWLH
ncbi:YdcF family protein [Octadecabacter sp. R77987]|uniref:YdcF family protein n=1 Tax=Octadecabacter sp. R77987 TaxID=3093874 RepID=UPI0036721E75